MIPEIIPEIIPTNFALNKEIFDKKLELLKFSPKIHIDFMDGKFTNKKSVTLNEMTELKNSNQFKEIHLMAYNPEKYLHKIIELKIQKVLIQEEVFKTSKDIKKAIDTFKTHDLELFIVLNPTTTIERIKKYSEFIDGIMIMSVCPGEEGQKFIEDTYNKIKKIRDFVCEGYPIQIDGGINLKNAKKIIESSANILSIGSAISSEKNPKENYKLFEKILNN